MTSLRSFWHALEDGRGPPVVEVGWCCALGLRCDQGPHHGLFVFDLLFEGILFLLSTGDGLGVEPVRDCFGRDVLPGGVLYDLLRLLSGETLRSLLPFLLLVLFALIPQLLLLLIGLLFPAQQISHRSR